MIRRTIYLDKYDWLADIYFDYKCKYSDDLIDKLEDMGISEERLDIAYADLNSCKDNIGLTYSSFIEKKTIVIIGEATNAKEFMKTFTHEIGHLSTHICQYYYIDVYGEEIHYIDQDIIEETWDIIKEYLCDCCNTKKK